MKFIRELSEMSKSMSGASTDAPSDFSIGRDTTMTARWEPTDDVGYCTNCNDHTTKQVCSVVMKSLRFRLCDKCKNTLIGLFKNLS